MSLLQISEGFLGVQIFGPGGMLDAFFVEFRVWPSRVSLAGGSILKTFRGLGPQISENIKRESALQNRAFQGLIGAFQGAWTVEGSRPVVETEGSYRPRKKKSFI